MSVFRMSLSSRSTIRLAYMLCCFTIVIIGVRLFASPVYAASKPKPALALNMQQGPLGVTLTLKGKNFHVGEANLNYVDALNTPGIFATPGSNIVQVQKNGTFTATNLLLPTSGPAGPWKIVVTDSAQTVATIAYLVLAAPGEQSAEAPSITTNPTSGKSGDVIALSGNNWLPQKTTVKLALIDATNSVVSLNTVLVSDKNGMLTGAFRLPLHLALSQTTVTIIATDSTGALQAQTHMTLLNLSISPIPTTAPTPTRAARIATTNSDSGKLSFSLSIGAAELIILIVGGTIGLAGLMLVLFLVPWGKPKKAKIAINEGDTFAERLYWHVPTVGHPGSQERLSSPLKAQRKTHSSHIGK